MARPQRNNVDYFPFYCEEGKKMYYLEETYGNDGFAVFMKILRELAKTDYHYLDLSKNTTLMFLSAKCKVSKDILKAIINDLVDLEKFDAVLWSENSIIWCQDFIDSIQDAYLKRTNDCITYDGLLQLLTSLGIRKPNKSTRKPPKSKSKGDVNPQTILKKTKEDKIKEKLRGFEWVNFDYEIPLIKWLVYKSDRSENYKSTDSLKVLHDKLIKLSKNNKDVALEIVEQSMGNNWAGIFELKESSKKELPFNQDINGMNYSQNPNDV